MNLKFSIIPILVLCLVCAGAASGHRPAVSERFDRVHGTDSGDTNIEILNVKHTPDEPKDTDIIEISCDVNAEGSTISSVEITICKGDTCYLPEAMTDLGGGKYSYTTGPYEAGTDVSYEITVKDSEDNSQSTEKLHILIQDSGINGEDDDDDDDDSPGFEVLGLIGTGVILATMAYWRRRR